MSERRRAAQRLGERIRAARRARGWDAGELARRAVISRTTLHQLERGETARPRSSTLSRVAEALGLVPSELHAILEAEPAGGTGSAPAAASVDRVTNHAISRVFEERPELFGGWSREEWDELYSTFGTGGALNERGVVAEAERIARRREVVDRVHVLMETHLAEVAERMIDTLYRMVCPGDAEWLDRPSSAGDR